MRPITRICDTTGVLGTNPSAVVPIDYNAVNFNVGFGCVVVSGNPTYTVQHTFDNIFDPTITPTWFNNTFVVNQTTNQDGNYASGITALRLAITSGAGVVKVVVVQSSPGGN